MVLALPCRSPLPALCLCASSALAGPVEDCRNPDFADAVRVEPCTTAIKAAGDPAERADLLLHRGAIQGRLGSLEAAETDFAAAVAMLPDWADPHLERAYVLQDQGDMAGALVMAEGAWEVEPASPNAAQSIMYFLAELGRYEDCLEAGARAVEIGPEDPDILAARGRCLAETGDHAAVEADARRAIELGLEEGYVHGNLAWSLIELGRPEEAVAAARTALKFDPADPVTRRHLARALALTEGAEAGIAAWREASPEDTALRRDIANDIAWDLYEDGQAVEALPFIEDAMAAMRSLGERSANVMDTYAHILAATGQAEEATQAFSKADRAEPLRLLRFARRMDELGVPDGASGSEAAFLACARMGAACRLTD